MRSPRYYSHSTGFSTSSTKIRSVQQFTWLPACKHAESFLRIYIYPSPTPLAAIDSQRSRPRSKSNRAEAFACPPRGQVSGSVSPLPRMKGFWLAPSTLFIVIAAVDTFAIRGRRALRSPFSARCIPRANAKQSRSARKITLVVLPIPGSRRRRLEAVTNTAFFHRLCVALSRSTIYWHGVRSWGHSLPRPRSVRRRLRRARGNLQGLARWT